MVLPDHCRPFQTEAPAMHTHVLGETHRLQHLRPEHPTVTKFDPLLELRVKSKDFEGGLGGHFSKVNASSMWNLHTSV